MARHGRRFPLSTSYQTLVRTVPEYPLAGTGTWTLAGVGALTLISTTVIETTGSGQANRFRSVLVPPLADLAEVQRQMQRNQDEIARAVNPTRNVADGGTGLAEVTAGSLVTGTGASTMQTVPIGALNYVLTSDGTMPIWAPAPGAAGGEVNTATSVGVGGVSLVNGKVGVDLQFRSVNALSPKITVVLDAGNKKVDFDITTGITSNSVCIGNDARLSDSRTPLAHKVSHQTGGSDEISVAGLLGVLTNPQPPIIGATGTTAVAGNDARLTDARTPTGAAAGVLSGTYPNPGFAVDMATQAELDAAMAAHLAASDPHPLYALDTDLLLYQLKADTRFDGLGSDRFGTYDYVEERAGQTATR